MSGCGGVCRVLFSAERHIICLLVRIKVPVHFPLILSHGNGIRRDMVGRVQARVGIIVNTRYQFTVTARGVVSACRIPQGPGSAPHAAAMAAAQPAAAHAVLPVRNRITRNRNGTRPWNMCTVASTIYPRDFRRKNERGRGRRVDEPGTPASGRAAASGERDGRDSVRPDVGQRSASTCGIIIFSCPLYGFMVMQIGIPT